MQTAQELHFDDEDGPADLLCVCVCVCVFMMTLLWICWKLAAAFAGQGSLLLGLLSARHACMVLAAPNVQRLPPRGPCRQAA